MNRPLSSGNTLGSTTTTPEMTSDMVTSAIGLGLTDSSGLEAAIPATVEDKWQSLPNDRQIAHLAHDDDVVAALVLGHHLAVHPGEDVVENRRARLGRFPTDAAEFVVAGGGEDTTHVFLVVGKDVDAE